MPKQKPPFPLRMPNELRQWLESSAQKNERSLNNEIVYRLKEMANAEGVRLES